MIIEEKVMINFHNNKNCKSLSTTKILSQVKPSPYQLTILWIDGGFLSNIHLQLTKNLRSEERVENGNSTSLISYYWQVSLLLNST